MAASTLTLRLDDGSDVSVLIEGELDDRLAALLVSGDQLRVRADDVDVAGHAISGMVAAWIAGPDDVSGHAVALRLPNAQAARDLQLKLIAGGALAVVVAAGAVVSQALPGSSVAAPGGATVASGAVHPGQTRAQLRTDSPVVRAEAVHPGTTREHLRTDAPSAAPPDGSGSSDDRQTIHRGPDKTLPGV
jgi:hypothetical protein